MMMRALSVLKAMLVLLLAISVAGAPAFAQSTGKSVRIKDIAHVQGVTGNQLIGYGVVVVL